MPQMLDTSENILIVIDNLECNWAETVKRKGKNKTFHLFTIGFSPAQALLKYRSLIPDLQQAVVVIDSAEIFRRAEEDARNFYLELIRDFPRQKNPSGFSVLEALRYRGRNLWWYLGMAEKNIWNDPFIHRLFALLRLFHACENGTYHSAVLHVDDAILRDALYELLAGKGMSVEQPRGIIMKRKTVRALVLSQLVQAGREAVKILATMVALKASGVNARNDLAPGTTGFFSTYPDWWKNPFLENASDLFFDGIPDTLGKEGPVRYFLWLMPWRSLFSHRKEAVSFFRSRPITVLESQLKISDVLSLFDPQLFLCCLRALKSCRQHAAGIKGIDISSWIQDAFCASLTSPMFFNCLSLDRAVKRIPLKELKVLFFRLEFQPLERAILNSTRAKTVTVGFQHSALGNNFLNYIFADGELGGHWTDRSSPDSMPLPDHIFTSGELGVRFMQRAGYPEKRLTIAGALRFRHLYDYMKQMPAGEALRKQYGVPQGKSVILVATSPLLQETICMLTDLLEAAEQSRIDMHVIIRCHPEAVHLPGYVAQLERIAQAAGRKITYEFLSGPVSLQDYISLSDAVLLTGGTVALEAMILGCLPLIYMNDSQFSHNPMKEYPDAVLLIDSPAAMKAALDDVFNGRAAQRLRPLWKRPLTDMFSGTSEDPAITFLKAVRERIQILSPPGEDKLY